jgi:hypothetical protein
MQAAEWLVYALAAYAAAGIMFAAAFVVWGIRRVDPVAQHSPMGFRLIVMPGVVALWPLMLTRWMGGGRVIHDAQAKPPAPPIHLRIWVVLALALCTLLIAGLLVRRTSTPPNANLHWEQYR